MWATYSRIFMGPLLLPCFYLDPLYAGWVAAILFILGSLTDWLDGFWARKYQCESNMGKLMDPIADKILVLGALVVLLSMLRVDTVTVFLLLGRDIFIGGLRSVAAANQVIIAARPFGKWKTAFQMVGIPCLFIYEPTLGLPLAEIGRSLLWLSVVLSVISGFQYTLGYYKGRKSH
jgi:CDP-diacylglycerol--glycerol-3-phosphate 3-phosphatidyltransferase